MALSREESEDLRTILTAMYGDMASDWSMNEQVLAVLNEITERNKACSVAMDFVPRPLMGRPDLKYIRSQLRAIAQRVAKRNVFGSGPYWICSEMTKAHYKFKFVEASQFGEGW